MPLNDTDAIKHLTDCPVIVMRLDETKWNFFVLLWPLKLEPDIKYKFY